MFLSKQNTLFRSFSLLVLVVFTSVDLLWGKAGSFLSKEPVHLSPASVVQSSSPAKSLPNTPDLRGAFDQVYQELLAKAEKEGARPKIKKEPTSFSTLLHAALPERTTQLKALKQPSKAEKLVPKYIRNLSYLDAQTSELIQALAELIANGQDTHIETYLGEKGQTIGRFGLGALQVFGELIEKDSDGELLKECFQRAVILETQVKGTNQLSTFMFYLNQKGEIVFNRMREKVSAKEPPFSTRITVIRDLSKAEIQERTDYLKRVFHLNRRVPINITSYANSEAVTTSQINAQNGYQVFSEGPPPEIDSRLQDHPVEVLFDVSGYQVIDQGQGMSEDFILKKFLDPKAGSKSVENVVSDEGETVVSSPLVYFKLNDINEEKPQLGIWLNGRLIVQKQLDDRAKSFSEIHFVFPHNANTTEDWLSLALDDVSVAAIKKMMARLVDPNQEIESRFLLIQGLVDLIEQLQPNGEFGAEGDLLAYFAEQLEPELSVLTEVSVYPNEAVWAQLKRSEEAVFLSAKLVSQTSALFTEMRRLNEGQSSSLAGTGVRIYVAPFKESSEEPLFYGIDEAGKWIVLSEKVWNQNSESNFTNLKKIIRPIPWPKQEVRKKKKVEEPVRVNRNWVRSSLVLAVTMLLLLLPISYFTGSKIVDASLTPETEIASVDTSQNPFDLEGKTPVVPPTSQPNTSSTTTTSSNNPDSQSNTGLVTQPNTGDGSVTDGSTPQPNVGEGNATDGSTPQPNTGEGNATGGSTTQPNTGEGNAAGRSTTPQPTRTSNAITGSSTSAAAQQERRGGGSGIDFSRTPRSPGSFFSHEGESTTSWNRAEQLDSVRTSFSSARTRTPVILIDGDVSRIERAPFIVQSYDLQDAQGRGRISPYLSKASDSSSYLGTVRMRSQVFLNVEEGQSLRLLLPWNGMLWSVKMIDREGRLQTWSMNGRDSNLFTMPRSGEYRLEWTVRLYSSVRWTTGPGQLSDAERIAFELAYHDIFESQVGRSLSSLRLASEQTRLNAVIRIMEQNFAYDLGQDYEFDGHSWFSTFRTLRSQNSDGRAHVVCNGTARYFYIIARALNLRAIYHVAETVDGHRFYADGPGHAFASVRVNNQWRWIETTALVPKIEPAPQARDSTPATRRSTPENRDQSPSDSRPTEEASTVPAPSSQQGPPSKPFFSEETKESIRNFFNAIGSVLNTIGYGLNWFWDNVLAWLLLYFTLLFSTAHLIKNERFMMEQAISDESPRDEVGRFFIDVIVYLVAFLLVLEKTSSIMVESGIHILALGFHKVLLGVLGVLFLTQLFRYLFTMVVVLPIFALRALKKAWIEFREAWWYEMVPVVQQEGFLAINRPQKQIDRKASIFFNGAEVTSLSTGDGIQRVTQFGDRTFFLTEPSNFFFRFLFKGEYNGLHQIDQNGILVNLSDPLLDSPHGLRNIKLYQDGAFLFFKGEVIHGFRSNWTSFLIRFSKNGQYQKYTLFRGGKPKHSDFIHNDDGSLYIVMEFADRIRVDYIDAAGESHNISDQFEDVKSIKVNKALKYGFAQVKENDVEVSSFIFFKPEGVIESYVLGSGRIGEVTYHGNHSHYTFHHSEEAISVRYDIGIKKKEIVVTRIRNVTVDDVYSLELFSENEVAALNASPESNSFTLQGTNYHVELNGLKFLDEEGRSQYQPYPLPYLRYLGSNSEHAYFFGRNDSIIYPVYRMNAQGNFVLLDGDNSLPTRLDQATRKVFLQKKHSDRLFLVVIEDRKYTVLNDLLLKKDEAFLELDISQDVYGNSLILARIANGTESDQFRLYWNGLPYKFKDASVDRKKNRKKQKLYGLLIDALLTERDLGGQLSFQLKNIKNWSPYHLSTAYAVNRRSLDSKVIAELESILEEFMDDPEELMAVFQFSSKLLSLGLKEMLIVFKRWLAFPKDLRDEMLEKLKEENYLKGLKDAAFFDTLSEDSQIYIYLLQGKEEYVLRKEGDFKGVPQLGRALSVSPQNELWIPPNTSLSQVTQGIEEKERDLEDEKVRVLKTVTNQDKKGRLYLRELIQNARDASLKAKQSRYSRQNPEIHLRSYLREAGEESLEWVFSVRDKVGITGDDLITYLLNPDSSTKSSSKNELSGDGFLGQGFFTIFNDASEVQIRTGKNGTVIEARLQPVYDPSSGILKDIRLLSIKRYRGRYQGSVIEKIHRVSKKGGIDSEGVYSLTRTESILEHAYSWKLLQKYVGAIQKSMEKVPGVKIFWNGTAFNEKRVVLAEEKDRDEGKRIELTQGELQIERITLNHLFVQTIEPVYLAHKDIPEWLKKRVHELKLNLNFPKGTQPIRTRTALKNPRQYQERIRNLLFKWTIEKYKEGTLHIPGLPDYKSFLSNPRQYGPGRVNDDLAPLLSYPRFKDSLWAEQELKSQADADAARSKEFDLSLSDEPALQAYAWMVKQLYILVLKDSSTGKQLWIRLSLSELDQRLVELESFLKSGKPISSWVEELSRILFTEKESRRKALGRLFLSQDRWKQWHQQLQSSLGSLSVDQAVQQAREKLAKMKESDPSLQVVIRFQREDRFPHQFPSIQKVVSRDPQALNRLKEALLQSTPWDREGTRQWYHRQATSLSVRGVQSAFSQLDSVESSL